MNFINIIQHGIFFWDGIVDSTPLWITAIIVSIVVPYLLGSINFAIITTKLFTGNDVRASGSGNAGMTNMLRTYGKKMAVITLLGDFVKAVVAVLV